MGDKESSSFAYRTEDNPAPGELVRVQGFLNTWSDELGIEDFPTPRATEKWLRAAGLWEGSKPMNRDDHRRVLEFRDLVRRCVANRDEFGEMTRAVAHTTFSLDFRGNVPALKPETRSACDRALGQLSAIIYTSMIDGTWSRFKCCALPSCRWAYYDSTRSRTKKWCSMQTCGSRHKAREYYKRHR
ncbi:MAG: CGNR zinc finger domain-containing protein [Pseudomonadota bacterium]